MKIRKEDKCCATCALTKTDACLGCGDFKHYKPTEDQKRLIKVIYDMYENYKRFKTSKESFDNEYCNEPVK